MSESLLIPWTAALLASLPFTISWSLLRFMSIELVILSNCLSLCCLFLLLSSIFPSIRVFSNESVLYIRWPRYWIFSFSISPSNEFSGLVFFRIDWFDLLAVQGTLKSLLENHSLKTSVLWHSAFFKVQFSHLYCTTRKNSFDYRELCQKTTRPFRYNLNQLPYDYIVEMMNSFKGLDHVDRVSEELWTEVCNIISLYFLIISFSNY